MAEKRLWLPPPHALRGYTNRDQERLLVAYDASLTEREEDRAKLDKILKDLTAAGKKKLEVYNEIRAMVIWDIDDFAELVGVDKFDDIDNRSDWGSGTPLSFVEEYAAEHEIDVDEAWMRISDDERDEAYRSYRNDLTAAVFRYSDGWMSWNEVPVAVAGAEPYEWEFVVGNGSDDAWKRRAKKIDEDENNMNEREYPRSLLASVKLVVGQFEADFDASDAKRFYYNR